MTADDWVKIISAFATGVALVLGALGTLYAKLHAVGEQVNGRMTELLSLTRSSAHAEGALAANADPRTAPVHDAGTASDAKGAP